MPLLGGEVVFLVEFLFGLLVGFFSPFQILPISNGNQDTQDTGLSLLFTAISYVVDSGNIIAKYVSLLFA